MTSVRPITPRPSGPAPQLEGLHQVQFRLIRDGSSRKLVALRDLSPGDLIFTEAPLASGPGDREGLCAVCYSPITAQLCDRCWWPVCSSACQTSPVHSKECRLLAACLQRPGDSCLPTRHILALRLLLLRDQGGRDWDTMVTLAQEECEAGLQDVRDLGMFLREDCGLTVTGEELELVVRLASRSIGLTVRGRQVPALYPTAALLPHSCTPNTRAVYRRAGHKLLLHAATNIQRGETLSLSRLRNQELLLTGTMERKLLLGPFQCDCARCKDPTELGTYVSGILCQHCEGGICLPPDLRNTSALWQCQRCHSSLDWSFVSTLVLSLQDEDSAPTSRAQLSAFLEKHQSILPDHHFLVTRQKSRYFFQPSLASPEEYWAKVTIGREILHLADVLEPGLSASREAILVTLATCLQFLLGSEVMRRLTWTEEEEDDELLTEHQIYAAFRDATVCFREALLAARLEEDPGDPEKTPTLMIETNLNILENMRADFENSNR